MNGPNSKVRSIEKTRKSSCLIADSIARRSIDAFSTLIDCKGLDISYEQTVISTILMYNGSSLDIVSMGIGTKYIIDDGTFNLDEKRVKDCHAEILAMRGFRFFLLNEIELSKTNSSDIFDWHGTYGTRKKNVEFHMYASSQPCGNACISRWAKGGIGPEFKDLSEFQFPNNDTHPLLNPPALKQGQVSILLKKPSQKDRLFSILSENGKIKSRLGSEFAYEDIPISSCPVGTSVAAPNIPSGGILTCSDKLMQRNVLGYQGKYLLIERLLNNERVHIESLTVGRKFKLKAAQRAMCCRVEGVVPEFECRVEQKEGEINTQEASTSKRQKLSKGCVYLPNPFGVRHQLFMSTKEKIDDGVYDMAADDDQDDDHETVTENNVDDDKKQKEGKDARFNQSACVVWCKVKLENNALLSYVLTQSAEEQSSKQCATESRRCVPVMGGCASVIDGLTGLTHQHGGESFISKRCLKIATQFVAECSLEEMNPHENYILAKKKLRTESLPFIFS